MNADMTLILLTIFVAMTAVSFAAQAVAMMRLAKTTKEMKERVDAFLPKAEKLIHTAETTLVESRAQINEITARANDILSLTQTQMVRVDELVADASSRAKIQLDRAETVLENTLTRVNDTVNSVHGTILRPIREITGVAAGVKAAVGHLLKGAPANVAQVTTDEEMFI
jgi:F0F1-type ATP synthase membrane subunit b/b'